MKNILKISTVLSWFNLVIGCLFTAIGLLIGLSAGNTPVLIACFLLSAIILHSYAALQLRKSINHPGTPLSAQTPTGIRFIGAIALFFGVAFFANSVSLLRNIPETLKLFPPELHQPKELQIASLRFGAGFGMLCGLSIALNVMLNFRLLRWYHFMKGMM
jgi:hypothetical protein